MRPSTWNVLCATVNIVAQLAVGALQLGRIAKGLDHDGAVAAVVAPAARRAADARAPAQSVCLRIMYSSSNRSDPRTAAACAQRLAGCLACIRATSAATRSGRSGSVNTACSFPSGPSSATLAVWSMS